MRGHNFLRMLLTIFCLLLWHQLTPAQSQCLSPDDIKRMQARLAAHEQPPLNKKLRERLLKLKKTNEQRRYEAVWENRNPTALIERMNQSDTKNMTEICAMLKEFGWPTASMVGADGLSAMFLLLRNGSSRELNVQLLPVITAAAKQKEISRPDIASYIDLLRLNAGLKQMFGTQATIIDGVIVLYPIQAEAQVDTRRKAYQLPPLANHIRVLQDTYRLPLIRSMGKLTNSFSEQTRKTIAQATAASVSEGEPIAENDVLRVETNLVSLNVSVSGQFIAGIGALEQKDFAVSEDGEAQTINFFGTTDMPFDLVLLLDVSGSTNSKRKLIRESTRRFIEAARPADRLAIVAFGDAPLVVSELSDDRAKLLASANKIEGQAGSNVWDALKFTLDQVIGARTLTRRRAIVFMTDGVDNSFAYAAAGSKISFADLLEAVRHNDTLIVPIYLDTEGSVVFPESKRIYENARKTLTLLADESGGPLYRARKIEDLDGIYAQVIEDLGKVYSLGYTPTRAQRDGLWRTVKVEVLNHPKLTTRTRPGYYAN